MKTANRVTKSSSGGTGSNVVRVTPVVTTTARSRQRSHSASSSSRPNSSIAVDAANKKSKNMSSDPSQGSNCNTNDNPSTQTNASTTTSNNKIETNASPTTVTSSTPPPITIPTRHKRSNSAPTTPHNANSTSIAVSESDYTKTLVDNSSHDESVTVVVRIRPPNQREISMNSEVCTNILNDKEIKIIRKEKISPDMDKTFTFDRVFGQYSTQEEVYEATGRRLLHRCISGYNGCVFAYGQTGSGKTWTMEGSSDQPGVMKRLSMDLFDYFNQRSSQIECRIRVSYLEIYNDNLIDLLARHKGINVKDMDLKIREDPVKGMYVSNLIQHPVTCHEDVFSVLEHGSEHRTKGETKMNAVSSRSHAVLTFYIDQQEVGDKDGFTLRQSKLHMVDLAGSERAGSTGAEGKRLMEGAKINLSLSALGNVINALVMNKPFVPYRDSKLTRLLQDSIGGNSITLMICALSPASINSEESLSTLKFADRAKQIKNKVKIARDPKLARIAELMAENMKLKLRIGYLEELLRTNNIPFAEQTPDGTAHESSEVVRKDLEQTIEDIEEIQVHQANTTDSRQTGALNSGQKRCNCGCTCCSEVAIVKQKKSCCSIM